MTPFTIGIIIGIWIGLYLVVHFYLNKNKPQEELPSPPIISYKNEQLVKDLTKIRDSLNSCIETIIFLDQLQENTKQNEITYHDEKLTQQILKLDQISDLDLKPIRKETIRCLQRTLDKFD